MAENLSNIGSHPDAWGAPSAEPVTEHATIGASIVIKGEVSGSEPLFIDGTVEGSVHCPELRVTIGRNSTVRPDIAAREVAVMGSVKGNIHCSDLVDLRAESNIQGEIITRRIRIDDGAVLKGSVEIQRAEKGAQAPEAFKAAPGEVEAKVKVQAPDEAAPAVAETERQNAAFEGGGSRRGGGAPGCWKQRTVQACALEIRCEWRGGCPEPPTLVIHHHG
jgi:cytoskeletal protein CcmA (bactofilin family)